MAPSQGRPPIENPKSERIYIRVTPEEKETIQNFSKEHKIPILELIRLGIKSVNKNSDCAEP